MTDVRDPDRRTDTIGSKREITPRQTLVARALSPIRRVTSREVEPAGRGDLELRDTEAFEREPKSKLNIVRWSVVLVILMPMFLSGLYLFFIASDQYVAEAHFAVRQVNSVSTGGGEGKGSEGKAGNMAAMLSGTANIGGPDAEIVSNYILSHAIIDDISTTIDVRAIFRRPNADFWARLPKNATNEQMVKYWDKMVSVYIEATSGIVTVSVSAFTREDALNLVQAIVKSSETLVNTISLKIRMDTMKTAEDEVRRSEGDVRFALANLTAFRNAEHLIDPIEAAKSSSKLLLQLMTDKIETESKLFVALRVQGPNAPGINSLRAKLDSANGQIAQIKDEMAGDKDANSNMAAALSRFEDLFLKQQFAEKMYSFAREGVERARIASIRQQIYLAVFVPPSLPQDYTYPLRLVDFLLISLFGLMTWVCGATITASVLDHRL